MIGKKKIHIKIKIRKKTISKDQIKEKNGNVKCISIELKYGLNICTSSFADMKEKYE